MEWIQNIQEQIFLSWSWLIPESNYPMILLPWNRIPRTSECSAKSEESQEEPAAALLWDEDTAAGFDKFWLFTLLLLFSRHFSANPSIDQIYWFLYKHWCQHSHITYSIKLGSFSVHSFSPKKLETLQITLYSTLRWLLSCFILYQENPIESLKFQSGLYNRVYHEILTLWQTSDKIHTDHKFRRRVYLEINTKELVIISQMW